MLRLQSSAANLLLCTDTLEGASGTNLVRRAKDHNPDIKVLMLIQLPIPSTILDAIDARCYGICSAQATGTGTVVAALTAIDSDCQYLDPLISGVCTTAGCAAAAIKCHCRNSPCGKRSGCAASAEA